MITMNELVDLRMQQHIAHEIYRQQIMQRIPDPFPLLPMPIPRHIMLPPRVTLPGVDATLQNLDLWKQFHQIGTEMIITKSGRRMFPSMRLSLSGLEDDVNYCVLLEMVPIGDCRFKFSGSQWVPAGGAEPQSPQRMYLHPDSPATGSHWQAQPILFNKVKLTNNTLDSNGHVVLTSMHKYQPRIHVIRTSDPTQIPWAPQQPFIFPETEFVAVTAYQNDRITKLKIDNNPFAKGFRETGQSRCKRKMASSPSLDNNNHQHQSSSLSSSSSSTTEISPIKSNDHFNVVNDHENRSDDNDSPLIKRMRSNSSACSTSSSLDDRDDRTQSFSSLISCSSSSGTSSPGTITADHHFRGHYSSSQHQNHHHHHHHHQQQQLINQHQLQQQQQQQLLQQQQQQQQHHHQQLQHHYPSIRNNELLMQHLQKNMQNLINPSLMDLACSYFGRNTTQSAQSVLSNTGLGGYSQSLLTSPTIQTTSLPISVTVGGNANVHNNNNINDINPSQFYSSSSSSSSSTTLNNHLVHSPSNSNGLSPLSTASSSASVSSTSPSVISVSMVSTAIGEQNLPGYYSPPINVDENHDDNDDDDNDNEQNDRNSTLNSNTNLNGNCSPVFSDNVNSINSSPSKLVTSSSASSKLNNSSDKLNDEINSDEDFVVKLPSKRNNFTISAILGGDN